MYWITSLWPFAKLGEQAFFHGSRKEKKVALTFDDGPSKQTKEILKILNKYNSKATFFIIGRKISHKNSILQKITKRGSEIGNHSYTHCRLLFKHKKNIEKEIKLTDKELRKAKIETKLFRPRDGSFGLNLISVCKKLNKKIILWDVDPSDWKCPSMKKIIKKVIRDAKAGSIIDLHGYAESYGKNEHLPEALEVIIPTLQAKGYRFVTISELLKF